MKTTLNLIKDTKAFRLTLTLVLAALMSLFVFVPQALATTTLSIPVEQVFSLATAGIEREGTFSYELTRLNSASPMPAGSTGDTFTFTITGSATENVGPITFTHGGIFAYEVRSIATPQSGFVLDDTIYTVFIAVSNTAAGGLSAEIRAVYARSPGQSAPGTKVADGRIVFDKGYGSLASIPDDKIDPPLIHTVQGNPATPYTFTFRLTPAATNPAPLAAFAQIEAFNAPTPPTEAINITILGSGRGYFDTNWSYTRGGVFTYTITQIPSNNPSYNFRDADLNRTYTLTDTVRSENGQLVVDRVLVNAATNAQVSSMSFISIYQGDDREVQDRPGTTPGITGPKTGDYADPTAMLIVMALSAAIAAFTLFLIYMDRRSEEEHPCSEGMAAA